MSVWRVFIAFLAAISAGCAGAEAPSNFYEGRDIQLVIGLGAGGGYDLSARLAAQYLPEFIPGRPTIIARNMPGAGSIAAAEYLYNVAPRDGTVIAIVQPTFLLEKLIHRERKYDPEALGWIGRIDTSTVMGVIWRSSPAQSVEEAKHTKVVIAANGAIGTSATIPWALNRMIGTQYKVVLGYDTSAKMGLALENGEADALGSTSWDFLQTRPQWFTENKATIPYVISLQRFRKLPDVPTILELVPNALDKNALKLVASTSTIGRAFMTTPGVAPERLEILRKAFNAMVNDPGFIAEAKRRRLGVDPMSGAELQKLVADVMSQPNEVVERMKDATRAEH